MLQSGNFYIGKINLSVINLNNLTKVFDSNANKPVTALKNINVNVAAGEIFGIIGKSGAGKSTFLRILNLLEQPTSGSVSLDGKPLQTLTGKFLKQAQYEIGIIFQHFNLLSLRSVFQNIALPLELQGYKKSDIKKKVEELLQTVGLTHKSGAFIHQLSGGEKQRVAIARALAAKPKVLLCDEATSALDPQNTKSILALLKKINLELNLTIVLITHEMDVVKSICHKVAVLHQGEIIEQGDTVNVFSNPQNQITKSFVRHSLHEFLPEQLKHKMQPKEDTSTYPILRIAFKGNAASEPIVAHLVKEFKLFVNIIQANMELINNIMVGVMVLELIGEHKTTQQGIQYLKDKQLNVDILGYVPRTS